MGTEIIILLITNIVSPILTGYITWFQTKKKYYSEVDSTLIDNMKQSLEFYKTLCDDNKTRLQETTQELKEVREKNDNLQKDIAELRKQMLNLTMNICLDLTCKRRVQEVSEEAVQNNRYTK